MFYLIMFNKARFFGSAVVHLQLPGRPVAERLRLRVRALVAAGAGARVAAALGRLHRKALPALPPAAC